MTKKLIVEVKVRNIEDISAQGLQYAIQEGYSEEDLIIENVTEFPFPDYPYRADLADIYNDVLRISGEIKNSKLSEDDLKTVAKYVANSYNYKERNIFIKEELLRRSGTYIEGFTGKYSWRFYRSSEHPEGVYLPMVQSVDEEWYYANANTKHFKTVGEALIEAEGYLRGQKVKEEKIMYVELDENKEN
jgi:hypothetical protein